MLMPSVDGRGGRMNSQAEASPALTACPRTAPGALKQHPSPSLLALDGLQDLEAAHERLVYGHHRTSIVKLSAVVGRAEQGDELALGKKLITVLHDLVCTANKVHVLPLQERGDHVGAEDEGDTAVVLRPPCDVLVWICPEEVA